MTAHPHPDSQRCPFPHDALTHRPARPEAQPSTSDHVYLTSFAAGRDLLRSGARQAGFLAEVVDSAGNPNAGHEPVLYMEGDEHTEMRRATARYFTPAAVNGYQEMMARHADDLLAEFARRGEVNLDDLSLKLAVRVASQVVGLTDSRLPGMEKRIEGFVATGLNSEPGVTLKMNAVQGSQVAANLSLFMLLDVKPAIEARRRAPKDDLISYLLSRDYTDQEILTECITYGTAGMVTTREFITLAAWQLLRKPELRREYLHGTEKERHAILHELLRLDPVVTTLYRRTTDDLSVDGQNIPVGGVAELDIQAANLDPAIMGEDAGCLRPGRELPRGVQAQGLAFGDGNHRCPGAFLAIKESDVFLRRLLMWNDLQMVSEPTVTYNEVVKGYELRGLRLRLGSPA